MELPGLQEAFDKAALALKGRGIALRSAELGVGLFPSMAGLQALLSETPLGQNRGAILHLGTAGSANPAHVGALGLSNRFGYPLLVGEEVPEAAEAAWSCREFIGVEFPTDVEFPNGNKEAPLSPFVVSSWGVSVAEGRYREMGEGDVWENMEAAGAAYLCSRVEIPFQSLLYCTNHIGPQGRAEWKANYQKGGRALLAALESITPYIFL